MKIKGRNSRVKSQNRKWEGNSFKIALRRTFLKLLENPLEHLAARVDSFNCLSHLEVHNLFQDPDFLFKYQQADCLFTLAAETPVISMHHVCTCLCSHTHTHTHTITNTFIIRDFLIMCFLSFLRVSWFRQELVLN